MIWEILKIEPTADKKKITSAYRKLLAVTNPEDDQKAFMELREAYEKAIAYAESHSETKTLSPTEIWQRDLEELYEDFQRRIDVGEWKKLFQAEFCRSLDTRMQCEEILLHFLMDQYFIGHDVWLCFNEEFSWLDRVNELYENYPSDFVEYVIINGIRFPDTLPMKLFIPGKNGDECYAYLRQYLQIRRREGDPAEQTARLMSLPEQHPYGTALCLSYRTDVQNDMQALEDMRNLHLKYPEDAYIAQTLCESLTQKDLQEECLALAEKMLKIHPDHYHFTWYKALGIAEKGEYAEAVRLLDILIGDDAVDPQWKFDLNEKRTELNLHIIEDLEKKSGEGAEDSVLMELGWAYLENNRFEDAKGLIDRVTDTYDDRFNYYNLKSYIASALGKNDEAADSLRKLIEIIPGIPEDTDKNIRRKKRLGEAYARLGTALYDLDHDQAMEAFNQAVSVSEYPERVLDQIGMIYLQERKYTEAEETADRMIQVSPGLYRGYMIKAYACFFRHRDRDAYNAVEHALDLDGSDLQLYILKGRLLARNDGAEGVKEIAKFLTDSGMGDETSVLFLLGVIAEDIDHDPEKAEEYYERSLADVDENGSSYTYKSALVYRLLCLKGAHLNAYEEEDRQLMLSLCEQGLESEPDHFGLTDYKAWLKEKGEEYDEALALYLKLAEYPNHGYGVDEAVGHLYYRDLLKNADLSLKYYLAALEKGGSPSDHFYVGMCYLYMLKADEAEKHFKLLQEAEPDTVDSWFRLSYVYAMNNDLERALTHARKAVEIMKVKKGEYASYFKHLSDILRRMKRYDEAVEVIKEAMSLYDYPYGRRLIFDIYCQAGMLDKAGEHLKQWVKDNEQDSEFYDCCILLHMYRNKFDLAFLENKVSGRYLSKDRQFEVKHILSRYYADYKKEHKQLLEWLEYRMNNDAFDLSRIQGSAAMCCFRMKDMEKARAFAKDAMTEIDEHLNQFDPDRLLFLTRKIRLLAILGKKEEAKAAVREAKTLPLCQFCPEHTCKDLELFRMELAEVLGREDEVYERACRGHEIYPGEEEFIIEKHMLRKQGKNADRN